MHLTPEDARMIKLILVLWGVAGCAIAYMVYKLIKRFIRNENI
jgi:hypothetical protein